MANLRDRLRSLERCMPSSTLGPITRTDMQELDDRTLLRYAIQETERAIADGSADESFDAEFRDQLGVANDRELLELLQSWLAETEEYPHGQPS